METDIRKSGEKLFDYVDPKNRAMGKKGKMPDMNLPIWFDGQNINDCLLYTSTPSQLSHHLQDAPVELLLAFVSTPKLMKDHAILDAVSYTHLVITLFSSV